MKKFIMLLGMILVLSCGCDTASSGDIISVEYHDDTIPGSDYSFEINTKNQEVSMNNSHYSSTADGTTRKVNKLVKVDNSEVFDMIVKAYNSGVFNSEWLPVFCSDLEDIDVVLKDVVVATRYDEMWETLYKDNDLNGDDTLTSLEEFKSTWGIMISELEGSKSE